MHIHARVRKIARARTHTINAHVYAYIHTIHVLGTLLLGLSAHVNYAHVDVRESSEDNRQRKGQTRQG